MQANEKNASGAALKVSTSYSVPTTANIANAVAIDCRGYRKMGIEIVSGSITTLTIYNSSTADGTKFAAYSGASALTIGTLAAGRSVVLDVSGMGFVFLGGDAAAVANLKLQS